MESVSFAVKMKVIVILTMIVMANFCVEEITAKAITVQVKQVVQIAVLIQKITMAQIIGSKKVLLYIMILERLWLGSLKKFLLSEKLLVRLLILQEMQ